MGQTSTSNVFFRNRRHFDDGQHTIMESMGTRIVQKGEEGDGCPGKKKVSLLCLRKTGPSIEKALMTSSVIRKSQRGD